MILVSSLAELLVVPITRQFSYIWNYKTNFDKLNTEVQKLEGQRDRVQHSVDEARRNGKQIEQDVSDWLDRVKTMTDEVSEVNGENERADMKCFKGLCPNPKKRYQHSRKAVKKTEAVARLYDEGSFPTVSFRTIPEETWIPSYKGYMVFESRMSTLKNILDALSNPYVNMVGIYGTGGIGKTTLAKEIAQHAEDKKLFNAVSFAKVGVKPDIKEIQQEIAEKLGLTFLEESPSGRARSLRRRLKQEEKVLLVLDNIWDKLELKDVGIPFGNDGEGCKLLLTARILDVLLEMESLNNFKVGILDEGEAWSLYEKKAGVCDHLQALAKDVAKACEGLPIAIDSVAVALKNKKECEWKDALRKLTVPSTSNFEGVTAKTYLCIEISYDQLKEKELKSTFLLCCVMENTRIEDLLAYGKGLGIIEKVETMKDARNRVNTLLRKLKDSSLLLDINDYRFSLHDVVRDIGTSIASRDRNMFRNCTIRELVDKDALKNCVGISLYNIGKLPEEFECPKLQFFYLRTTSKDDCRVPDNFFSGMPKLKVLHLAGLELYPVPNSIRLLVELRTFYIDDCELRDIDFIVDIKQLEILRINGSYCYKIETFSKKMCNLTGLRSLDLNDCSGLINIPANVLSNFTELEELYLPHSQGGCNIKWEVEGVNILDELKHLTNLTALEIYIPDANVLPKGRFLSKKLERYEIMIGDYWIRFYMRHGTSGTSRIVRLKLKSSSCFDDVQKFLSLLDREGFPELEHLHVENSPCFRTVVDCLESESCHHFLYLESLNLHDVPNLERVHNHQLRAESFRRLRTITVRECHKLKNVFSFSTYIALPMLQEVNVSSSFIMEEIFAIRREEDINNDEGTDQIEFKQLHSLGLKSLPKLTSFCSINGNKDTLDTPTPLFNQKNDNLNFVLEKGGVASEFVKEGVEELSFEKLNCLLENGGVDSEVLKERGKVASLSLCQVVNEVEGCTVSGFKKSVDELSNVNLNFLLENGGVDSDIVKERGDVATLCCCQVVNRDNGCNVSGCKKRVEEPFHLSFSKSIKFIGRAVDFVRVMEHNKDNLDKVALDKDGSPFKCSKLELESRKGMGGRVERVRPCSSLSSDGELAIGLLFQLVRGLGVAFPSLEIIKIENMDDLEMIWPNQLCKDSFCNLKSLEVRKCNKLLTIFQSNMLERIMRLESLTICDCDWVEEIFDLQGIDFEESPPAKETLLRELDFNGLPELKHIWNKDPQRIFSYQKLNCVKVNHCMSMRYLFPVSIAESLLELEQLSVDNCGVEEIVGDDQGEAKVAATFVFPRITSLELNYLPRLKTFYRGVHTSQWQNLKRLILCGCDKVELFASKLFNFQENNEGQHDSTVQPLFMIEKVSFPSLEKIEISKMDDLKMIWKQLCKESFCNLKSLKVTECNKLITIFQSNMLEGITRLESLTISDCDLVEEIFDLQLIDFEESLPAKETLLRELIIFGLPELKYLWNKDPQKMFSFQKLRNVEVYGCMSLKYLFPVSIAESLLELERLYVHHCGVEEIVADDQREANVAATFVFARITSLELNDLPRLKTFYRGVHTSQWQNLKRLIMCGCDEVELFASELFNFQENNESQHESAVQPLFMVEKVTFPSLQEIKISMSNNLKIVWHMQAKESFCNINSMEVSCCDKLLTVFHINTLEGLSMLKSLTVFNCASVEEIFDVQKVNFEESHSSAITYQLQKLCIRGLPKLKHIWKKLAQAKLSSKRLPMPESLTVDDCNSLEEIFDLQEVNFEESYSTAVTNQLQQLCISRLPKLKHVWNIKDPQAELSFKSLQQVKVSDCQSLKDLFPASIARSLSQLVKLDVENCGQVEEIVAMEGEAKAAATIFDFPKVTSFRLNKLPQLRTFYPGVHSSKWLGLKELEVVGCDKIDLLASELFSHLDIPKQQPLFWDVEEVYNDRSVVFPLCILQRFRHLQELRLQSSSYNETFSYEEDEPHVGIDSNLEVQSSVNAIQLWPSSSVCFQNLTILEVWRCDGLKNLMTSLTAKSLVQLKEMNIEVCDSMIEVVAK
ncbi:hypothetical protein EZV62_007000 [Acer yangbiense]|uniref:AAA+ ATPase domain-containing protein n=1 Tax=Acer yangbiense TaxID=1000413 RepID=A0A5C7I922_9ROSI|nr:hypothetical protein EZV62_007000 [Acer yangbiense]